MTATVKSKQQKRGTHGRARKTTTKRATRPRAKKPRPVPSSLEKAAAKVMAGAASAVRALVPQLGVELGSATALLEKQHREVEQLFEAALATEDGRVRRRALDDIHRQLTMHTAIEETIFYPAVQGIGTEEATDMVLEAVEEHHVVKLVLKELPKVDPKADSFKAKMTVLKELVAHHVKEEEHEMFPMAERKLGPERSQELAEAMTAKAAKA